MPVTDINIVNRSLLRLGVSSISNFTNNDKGRICGTIYPTFSTSLLSMYPWRFAAKKSGSLTGGATPGNFWSNSFALPADFLTLRNVYNTNDVKARPMTSGYERFGDVIMTNESAIYIDYTYDIDEDLWPDWYAEFVTTAFCAEAAFPITEDAQKESFWRQKAFGTPNQNGEGGLYRVTKAIDSRQQPVIPFATPSLIAARFS